MTLQDGLLWGAIGALILGFALNEAYDAGAASKAVEILAATSDRDTARENVRTLQRTLDDANKKVLAYQAGTAADEKVKVELQEKGKTEAAAERARVEQAKVVTTSTDDVLRAYWEAE
ncbi:hypothetical protein [Pseudomonas sp. PNPG3]|uniref:hypothetical protein n=1 Tax=Pseudomonas sp. PNPG3 TaxID=2919497 RepID=UPI001FFD9A5D|nr:hypothetical protein [Pseudomonas sp. PNPG3]MCK2122141.1 hypothetical protein [Pseudomonas sp. PNPG3]